MIGPYGSVPLHVKHVAAGSQATSQKKKKKKLMPFQRDSTQRAAPGGFRILARAGVDAHSAVGPEGMDLSADEVAFRVERAHVELGRACLRENRVKSNARSSVTMLWAEL
eukprot:3796853-Rhodomonas_salina.2